MTFPPPSPTTLEDMQLNIIARVNTCVTHANNRLAINLAQPTISFDQRGKIAGCARLQNNTLKFNPVLLVDNYATFMSEVVPHEVCHLLTYTLFGRVRPHGKEWRSLMSQLFRLTGHTYHKMDVTKVSGKTFPYVCECGQIELSIRRHNKVQRQQQRYICRQCSEILQPL
ncbi:SprT family zinc-dependent metalloprotease [Paraglaciecola sp. 20A4]|uniref:SprT family zinc-dependent metalloprotease n=1 Tax=Paraglaciecola sp. 20A4 TaxID=2687288 RepID=UPI001F0CEB13|nr:SprT family zinc-dependent metalloprotease [Paraglaciecola sp. 20A4]